MYNLQVNGLEYVMNKTDEYLNVESIVDWQ